MRRRDFIALGGAAIAWPRAAQASEMRRLAVLTTFGDSDALAQGWDAAFRKGLEESGWHDGRNVKIDYRWAAGDADRLRAFAKELVSRQPDVIFAVITPTVAALLRETRALSIAFAQVSDPWPRLCRVARAAGRQRHGIHQHQYRIVNRRQMAGASQGDRARGPACCHDRQPSDGVICGLLSAPVRGRRPGKRGSSKRCGGPQRCRYRECHRAPRTRAGRWLRRFIQRFLRSAVSSDQRPRVLVSDALPQRSHHHLS